MTATPHRRTAFTLIELLVVIGIIALLISVLLPVLRTARMASQRIACQSNVRQLYLGITLYCNDNHDWYPTVGYWANGSGYVQYPDDWVYWQANRILDDSPIARYLNVRGDKLKNLLRCPADSFEARKSFLGISSGQGAYLYSYGLNEGVAANVRPPLSWRTKRVQWRRPAEKILITEWMSPNCSVWEYQVPLTRSHGQAVSKKTGTTMGIKATAAFMDGHLEAVDEDFSNDIRHVQPDG